MIAIANKEPRQRPAAWHGTFLALLPTIERSARIAFRNLRGEDHDDAVQEAVVRTCLAFRQLFLQGRASDAHPTVLARYAVAQIRAGRSVGTRMNIRDVLSHYAQRKKRFRVERLDHYESSDEVWREAIVEDPRTPVFDQVWFRIDFPLWLARLSGRDRRVAEALAVGDSTGEVAKRFGLTPGRVSQLRQAFYSSWRTFHGEDGVRGAA